MTTFSAVSPRTWRATSPPPRGAVGEGAAAGAPPPPPPAPPPPPPPPRGGSVGVGRPGGGPPHQRPPPPPALPPRCLVDVGGCRAADGLARLLHRGLRPLGTSPLQLGDHAGRGRQPEEVVGQQA